MPEYVFDVKLWTVARVSATNEAEARRRVAEVVDCINLMSNTPDPLSTGVVLSEASAEGEYDLIEEKNDGWHREAVNPREAAMAAARQYCEDRDWLDLGRRPLEIAEAALDAYTAALPVPEAVARLSVTQEEK